ncbi:hypothetical protein FALCPG4_015670 [Fusarium falciforme]
MAVEQKNVEVPQETKPNTTAPATETKPTEDTPAKTAPATTEDKRTEESKPAETTEEIPKAEDKMEVVQPVEEGHLSHKGQGLSFPKNLIASKEFFFFGSDATEPKALDHYLKTEKSAETAHSNIAWASYTGQGLLFVGDKKNPSSIISLADATEPETDGSYKFHFTSKGNKHSFKATSTAERDNWVAQLKLKIAEAKELAATVTESETYKKTLEGFKHPPSKKEEEAPEAPKGEAKTEEPASAVAAAAEETPKEEEEERKKDDAKPAETTTEPAAETQAPKAEEAPATEAAPAIEEVKPEEKSAEEKPAEETKTEERVKEDAMEEAKEEAKTAAQRAAQQLRACGSGAALPATPGLAPVLASFGEIAEKSPEERKIMALETIAEAARLWILNKPDEEDEEEMEEDN